MLLPLLLAAATAAHADSVPVAPLDDFAAAGAPMHLAGTPVRAEPSPGTPRHPLAAFHVLAVGVGPLLQAERTVTAEVQRGAFPGAALVIGRWDQAVVERGIGSLEWGLGSTQVDPDHTVYDLASLTKVVGTTTAVMLLVEDGKLELDAPVGRYLPEFAGGAKDRVTIRHLLAHTSGLPAWANVVSSTAEQTLARALATPLQRAPGARAEYSDIGFVTLYAAAERAAGEPLHRLLDRRVFGPLGMRSTMFMPGTWCDRCAPTGLRRDGSLYRGEVHDPIARALGGVAGNAGLFSTAHDLSRFAAMLAQGGELQGVRVLREETIRQFIQRQPGAGTRALGWDTPDPRGGGAAGRGISPRAFGHTGFTGTSLWVDPDRGTWTVLLANRTFQPRADNRIQSLRRQVHDSVAVAVDRPVDLLPD